jgi:hypothetical protein
MVTTMVLGAFGLTATAQQDASKKITPLPGAEQSIDNLIESVRTLRKSKDLTKHQEHSLLRLAEKADSEFDGQSFAQSLKFLGKFQSHLMEEIAEGAISQTTFDNLSNLNSTAMALVSGQQQAKPTLGVSAVSCTTASNGDISFTWTVSWMNQPNQFNASVMVTALWTTADGTSLSSSMNLGTTNFVGGGAAKPTNDFSSGGSVTRPAMPQGVGGAQIKVTITSAMIGNMKLDVSPASATTTFCVFGS